MRTNGEPISKGQVDRRVAETRARREALLGVALFSGVVLVNGSLAILFIALMQALGLWTPVMGETALVSLEGELRTGLQSLPSGEE